MGALNNVHQTSVHWVGSALVVCSLLVALHQLTTTTESRHIVYYAPSNNGQTSTPQPH